MRECVIPKVRMTEETDQPQKHPGGRPLKFKTVEELDDASQHYFDMPDPRVVHYQAEAGRKENGETIWETRTKYSDQKPYTSYGLARALGVDRKTLLNYKKRDEYFPSVQGALDRIAEYAESQLYGPYANGAKFSLANNFKSDEWTDKQSVDHTTNGKDINPYSELSAAELRKLAAKGK